MLKIKILMFEIRVRILMLLLTEAKYFFRIGCVFITMNFVSLVDLVIKVINFCKNIVVAWIYNYNYFTKVDYIIDV